MHLQFRAAKPDDAEACVALRGKTRENAFSEEQLRSIGVTAKSWGENIRSGALPGDVCINDGEIVGYCFGAAATGEIEVLAVMPAYENRGIGRELLARTSGRLAELGHRRLFLACSPYPSSRSYGFYRHLGWRSTGRFDDRGDEILECFTGI